MVCRPLQTRRCWKLGLLTWAKCHLQMKAVPSDFPPTVQRRGAFIQHWQRSCQTACCRTWCSRQRWKRPASWPMNWESTVQKVFLFSFERHFYAHLWRCVSEHRFWSLTGPVQTLLLLFSLHWETSRFTFPRLFPWAVVLTEKAGCLKIFV